MSERSPIEHATLMPDTARLLHRVEVETGRPVLISADQTIRGRGRAIYVVSDSNTDYHNVLVDPAESPYTDHLVAHESGHIIRFHRAQTDERMIPVLTGERRGQALRQLLPEIQALVRRGIPEKAIAEVYSIWLIGAIAQVSDTPADIRIEQWIWREFPALRGVQEQSLRRQMQAVHLVMGKAVEAATPASVWRASNAMNYALAKATGELLDDPSFTEPYKDSWAEEVGDQLFQIVEEGPDLGLANDRRLSYAWANKLGLQNWFEWRNLNSLPQGFRHAWE